MASEQDIQLAQGALFVIDNTGPCPTGKKYRTFIDAAIAHHLTRHTYYYQDRGRPGAKNTKRATARKFRNSLQALWEHVKPESRSRKGGDRAEALFTLKSEGITAKALEMYRYDPATFLENDLPGFVDDGGDILQPREQTRAASTPAPEQQQVQAPGLSSKRRSESPDEPQQRAAKRPRTEEPIADTDHNSRPPQMSDSSRQLSPASRSPPRPPRAPLPGPSAGSKRGLESSDKQQQNGAKRPRVDAAVSPTRRKMVRIKLPRCKRCEHANVQGCDGQRPCGKCKAAGIGVEECSGSEPKGKRQVGPDPDAPSTSNAIGPKTNLEFQRKKTTFGLEVSRGDVDERSGKVGDIAGSADAQGSPGGKRKRAINDTGIQAGSNAAQTTRAPDQPASPKRQATGPSVEDRTNDESPKPVAPVPEGMASGVLNVSNNGKTATVANETVVFDSTETTQDRKLYGVYQEPQGHKIDLGMFVRQMRKLKRDVELTALDLLACIGQIQNMLCPLDFDPSEGLAALYVRCWGVEWKEHAANELKAGCFRTVFNTMSLISAFIYERIFNKPAYDREVAQSVITKLQASGPTGEAILKALDWPKRGKCTWDRGNDQTANTSQRLRLLRLSRPSRLRKHEPYWPKRKPSFIRNYRRKRKPS